MILITGATGTVGKEVVKLLARSEEPIRVMVRDRNKAGAVAYPGVELVGGDFGRIETLDDAFSGAHKAFLLTPPGERQLEMEGNFVTALARSRVRHIVKLSALGADLKSPARLLRCHAESERRIQETGIGYTFLRPNGFMQNFLAFRDSIINRGEFYAPMGDGCSSIVDARDVAAVVAAVLEEHGHQNKVYDITGPESLSYADMAERLSFPLGKKVTYVDVPPEKTQDALLASGMSPWMTETLLELYAFWKFNGGSEVSGTVEHIAKKDPITFAEFAHDYAPQFGRTSRDTLGELMDTVNLDNMTPGA